MHPKKPFDKRVGNRALTVNRAVMSRPNPHAQQHRVMGLGHVPKSLASGAGSAGRPEPAPHAAIASTLKAANQSSVALTTLF